ncbi:MAG: DNA-binding protein [Candidatus Parvarchaeota archaeon]|jgi:DNA-binding TFAR19-related protein (PDSD5 family)|nr:DNA-binding protein [Candidatus Parvarchaeota archaeon]
MDYSNKNNSDELEQRKKIEQLRQEVLVKYLTKEARERLGNLRYAHPELAEDIENMLMQSALTGRLKTVIDDEKLKELLQTISQPKKEQKINFKNK